MNLGILDGNKVLEVKDAFVNKGIAASEWLRGETYDFIFAVGDDHTDEDLFDVLPEKAYSVKVVWLCPGPGSISAAGRSSGCF